MSDIPPDPLIEFGDCIIGRQINQSPPFIEQGGKKVVQIRVILSPNTIKRLVGLHAKWKPKNCVDKLGNPKENTGIYHINIPYEMVLTHIYIQHENGESDRKIRVLCGINREETDLTALEHRLLSRIEHLEKEQATLYGALAAKDYELAQAKIDVLSYVNHISEISSTITKQSGYKKEVEDDDEQKKKPGEGV